MNKKLKVIIASALVLCANSVTALSQEIEPKASQGKVKIEIVDELKLGDEKSTLIIPKNIIAYDDEELSDAVIREIERINGTNIVSLSMSSSQVGNSAIAVVRVMDSYGNSGSGTIRITIKKRPTPPKINFTDLEIKKGKEFDPMQGVIAYDEEDGSLTNQIEILQNNVNTDKVGVYTVEYSVTDSDNMTTTKNRTVKVHNGQAPILVVENISIKKGEKFDPLKYVTATDAEDGNLTSEVKVIENSVDMTKVGEYKVKYEIEDIDGNITSKTITVKVHNGEKPVLVIENISIKVGMEFNAFDYVKASDKEDGDITSDIKVIKNNVDVSKEGIYQVEFEVIDSDGNSAVKVMNVKVEANIGWIYENNNWYYYDESGIKVTGWNIIDGTYYHMQSSGAMTTGWYHDGYDWYYLNENGIMQTGWKEINGEYYHMQSSGVMTTGWYHDGYDWYYLNENGTMANNQWIGEYYLNNNGVMATNQWIGGYYCNSNGKYVRSQWVNDNGIWYYCNEQGLYFYNTSKYIDGKTYNFASNGACLNP